MRYNVFEAPVLKDLNITILPKQKVSNKAYKFFPYIFLLLK